MAEEDAARRITADASSDLAIGIGPDNSLRFISMGLLDELLQEGKTEEDVYKMIPPGKTVMVRSQFANTQPTSLSAVVQSALRAIDGK